MPLITISAASHAAILAHASPDFRVTGARNDDGSWTIPVADDTLARIQERQLEGETLSDCILRVCFGPVS